MKPVSSRPHIKPPPSIKDIRTNCFCTSLLRRQIQTLRHASMRVLSNKMKNDRADGHCYSFAGFNDLGRSVTPIFLLMDHFLYRLSTFSEKMKKIYRLKV